MSATSCESERLATSDGLPAADSSHLLPSGSEPPDPLIHLWENLVRRRLRPIYEGLTRHSVRFVAQITLGSHALGAAEASLVQSVLCGEARKALACDLGIALSTTTGRYLRALAKLHLSDCTMPLSIVLAAQSHAGLARIPSARSTYVDHEGCRCLSVSVPRPVTACLTALTPGQQQVAQWLIEGGTRETIAERRSTSVYTVAGQVHAIFHALRVTGRYALIRQVRDLGSFSQPAMSVS
jgi:DNA-binding NarL/FixJ family response regulator